MSCTVAVLWSADQGLWSQQHSSPISKGLSLGV